MLEHEVVYKIVVYKMKQCLVLKQTLSGSAASILLSVHYESDSVIRVQC